MTTEEPMPRGDAAADPSAFPAPNFPIQQIGGVLAFSFALKNPEAHQSASRAVEAAKKVLQDAGAVIEISFQEPAA
jgi:hypothetical protein